jgi:outer membrane protein assembly factor BamB
MAARFPHISIAATLAALALGGLPGGTAQARTSDATSTSAAMRLSPTSGPPGARLTVSGSGFGAGETVGIYFDRTRLGQALTDAGGAFPRTAVVVPYAAPPGRHAVLAVGAVSALSAAKTFTVSVDWPSFRHDAANTGTNPYESTIGTANVSQLTMKWSYNPGISYDLATPTVYKGVVYASVGQVLHALGSVTGAPLWSFTTSGGPMEASPAIANNVVYVASYGGTLYALNWWTGALLWSHPIGVDVEASPVVANGIVYVGSDDGNLYALDATSGSLVWSTFCGCTGFDSPTVVGGVVYASTPGTSATSRLYAFKASTGQLLWTANEGQSTLFSAQAVANGRIYIASPDNRVYALSASTGAVIWSHDTGIELVGSPAVAKGLVYVSGLGVDPGVPDGMVALDASTGAVVWTKTFPMGHPYSSPTVANGVVYVGVGGAVLALDAATGSQLLQISMGLQDVNASPTIVDGRLFIIPALGTVYSFGLP